LISRGLPEHHDFACLAF